MEIGDGFNHPLWPRSSCRPSFVQGLWFGTAFNQPTASDGWLRGRVRSQSLVSGMNGDQPVGDDGVVGPPSLQVVSLADDCNWAIAGFVV